jgi:tight adherence protein C
MLPAIALLAASVALGVYAVLAQAQDRRTVRESLRALDDYEVTDLRERELLIPLTQRVLRPLGRSLVAVGRGLMPAGYMVGVRNKLLAPEDVDRFRAIRVLTVALIPFIVVAVFALLPGSPRAKVLVAGLLALIAALGPDLQLNRDMAERQHAIQVRLPDIIDLLTISVEAGLGFEQALDRTVATVPGPLSDEFARMLGELRAGAGRSDAMRNLDERTRVPELHSFILALIQADTFGVSIGRILRAQADEIRVKRRQLAQEEAQKAPVKLLFPMVLCVFPGIFVVLLGPAALTYMASKF